MGWLNDTMAVVDIHARVIGLKGLKVFDASAFLDLLPGHPQATVCKYCIGFPLLQILANNQMRSWRRWLAISQANAVIMHLFAIWSLNFGSSVGGWAAYRLGPISSEHVEC